MSLTVAKFWDDKQRNVLTGLDDALQTAAHKGNERLVKLLLDRGADIKAPEGNSGQYPGE